MDIFFEEYVKINGIEEYFIHYPKRSNTSLIFLHGGPGESEAYFLYKMHSKNQNYNLVYYDQRGTGKTQLKNKSKENDITIEKLLLDLKETINYVKEKYKSKYIILLGHSFGSVLGIEFIKKYPNTVSAYIGMGQVVSFKVGEKTGFDYCFDLVKKSGSKKYIEKMCKLKNYPFEQLTKLIKPFEKQIRIVLFNFFPLLKIKIVEDKYYFKLFNCIPLVKIKIKKNVKAFYLFYCISFLKIKF